MVPMDFTQKFTVTLAPVVLATGKPGSVDAPPTWPMSPAGILTPVISADGLSAEFRGIDGQVGTVTITPTGVGGGATFKGNDIVVNVSAPPVQPATGFVETIGPVVSQ